MCGICGIYNPEGKAIDQALLVQMTDLIRHRGPDDEGYTLFSRKNRTALTAAGKETVAALQEQLPQMPVTLEADLAFGFRRLSILDLSEKGHQPLASTDGSCRIIFNGEIYNYRELRSELKQLGYSFETNTDTEVILNAYRQWGTACQQRFIGMWAFALYDLTNGLLFCSRDRYGIKPFYLQLS